MNVRRLISVLVFAFASLPAAAEDGYDLWLRYRAVDPAVYPALDASVRELVGGAGSATLEVAGTELARGLAGLLGSPIPLVKEAKQAGAVLFGSCGPGWPSEFGRWGDALGRSARHVHGCRGGEPGVPLVRQASAGYHGVPAHRDAIDSG